MHNINFATFPIINTDRLTLRQLSVDDEHQILALRSDAIINQYLDRELSKTLADAQQFINMVNHNFANAKSIYWGISITNSDIIIGCICLFDFNIANSSCEIGYELLTAFQKQGMMQEAMQAVIRYAIVEAQLQTIIASVHCKNLNSISLLEKFNFQASHNVAENNADYQNYILSNKKIST